MMQLVVGECPSCCKSARILLRKCGYAVNTDYYEVPRFDLRKSRLFQERPELYAMATAILYNRDTGEYINLKSLQLTQEVRNAIKTLFES